MIDYVNLYLAARPGRVRAPIICKDGTILSVQASEGHYCNPRHREGPWSCVEVSVSNNRLRFDAWGLESERWSGGRIWGYLNVDKVNAEIERRGGLTDCQQRLIEAAQVAHEPDADGLQIDPAFVEKLRKDFPQNPGD